ncbi:MAG: RNA-guided endonuclease TnpB family protein [Candidatus Hodarchaeota archaeon]
MLVKKAYKFRLYPDRAQVVQLHKTFGCTRKLWNEMLAERKAVYDEFKDDKEALHAHAYKTEKEYKVDLPYLKEVDSIALQQSRIDLLAAYTNFFEKRAGFPKFKSRRAKQSYRTQYTNDNIKVDFDNKRIKLPKTSWIDYRDDRRFDERVRNVTVSKTKSGKYFASILVEEENDAEPLAEIHESSIVAFDMSAASFLVGEQISLYNPRFYRKHEKKLKKLHRILSRRQPGSNGWYEAVNKLARLYETIHNQKNDWMHKVALGLAREHDVVVLEDLSIEGMKQFNPGLSKTVTLDFSWHAFTCILRYKLEWRGKHLVTVDRFFASSKQCSNPDCDFKNEDLDLKDRDWTCPECYTHHDRDENAARNLKKEGMRILEEEMGISIIKNIMIATSSTAGTAGSYAPGDHVRPVITMAGSTKGESPTFKAG